MIIEFTKGSVRTNSTVLDSAHVERRKPAEFMISKLKDYSSKRSNKSVKRTIV